MGLFSRTPKLDKVQGSSQRTTGRIVGIDIYDKQGDENSSKERFEHYAIDVRPGGPDVPTGVVGLLQGLEPTHLVRLGMEVQLWALSGVVAIDWAASAGGRADATYWKPTKKPPDLGISDSTIGLDRAQRKGVSGTVTVNNAGTKSRMMGMKQALALDVTVEAPGAVPYDTEIEKVTVPPYAAHLLEIGARLPAWVRPNRPDNVVIDWPAAAMADPGIGRPASELFTKFHVRETYQGSMGAPVDTAVDTGSYPPIEGVDFDKWIEVQVALTRNMVAPNQYDAYAQSMGVAPGAWAAANSGWHQRMMSDWRLGMATGEALEAAQNQR